MSTEETIEHDDYNDYNDYDDCDDYEHDEHDEFISGWCSECGKECDGKVIDDGIGPYEFWGSKYVDHDYKVVSSCCEGEVLEYDPNDLD
jgi:hypothetical protein